PRAEQERLKREYYSIRQTDTETSTEFIQRFLRLAGFLGAAAGTAEEQAKNFQGQQSNRPVNSGFQYYMGLSEGYSYPVCTMCGRRHPGECRRASG
nr:zinc finger, CCHC-type, retrotransposon Gag domain protein [Tanacetum cinerariifolium]